MFIRTVVRAVCRVGIGGSGSRVLSGGPAAGVSSAEEEGGDEGGPAGFLRLLFIAPAVIRQEETSPPCDPTKDGRPYRQTTDSQEEARQVVYKM